MVNVCESTLVHTRLERCDVLHGKHAVQLCMNRLIGWRYRVLVFDTGLADAGRRIHSDVLRSAVTDMVRDDVLQGILKIAKDIGEFPLDILQGRAFSKAGELNSLSRDNFSRRRCDL